ncbi:MAG: hypothetical protein A3G34_05985 [Candidatus Lindowbacteria bacterium RIFCSPLOWO2_12_FULL_62_27]|nr:MAG: hypothetical protein A3G34_05985 [Candidatus Lindowbacteria bacterium RIFCSPLOWO2_12_FULL_62_27]OGH57481.1 MAG: hypothetical protein A3I06_06510 [Candidatus Lindowbacteria bacterium RIFCSPLOWO2_02_FULL_62_12]
MTETLNSLIDRIQKEGVEKADVASAEIIAKAKDTAALIVKEAESKAADILEKAKKDTESLTARSKKTLEQAARDIVLTVGQGVEKVFRDLADQGAGEALSGEVLEQTLVKICDAFLARGMTDGRLELLVNPSDVDRVNAYFKTRFRKALEAGVQIRPDGGIVAGFKVKLAGKSLSLDFTKESIAESVLQLLRPQLAEIVRGGLAAGRG